jgi:hypothetical protein
MPGQVHRHTAASRDDAVLTQRPLWRKRPEQISDCSAWLTQGDEPAKLNVMQAQHQQGATLRFSKVRPSVRKTSRAHAHLPTSWASQEARVISREAEKGCVPFVCPPLCLSPLFPPLFPGAIRNAAKRRPVGWGHDARNNLSGRANILSGLRCSKRAEFPKRFPKPTRRQSQCPCHIAAGLLTKPCLNNAIDSVGWVLDAVNAGRGGMLAAHPGFSILPCC